MRILLTGAAGFIGTAIAAQARELGHEVVGIDFMLDRAHAASEPLPDGVRRVDVRDESALLSCLDGIDAVCHQAAMVGLGQTIHDAPDYASHNTVGTAALLSAMTTAGVTRLVQASSMVVYGGGRSVCAEHGDVRPLHRTMDDLRAGRFDPACPHCGEAVTWGLVSEDAPLDPRNAYAATKLSQEHLAIAWVEQAGGRAISLRYHNVYGPGMPRDTPYAGVASIFRSALAAGEAPRVFEDGAQMRDFIHVADIARANLLALTADAPAAGRMDDPAAGHMAYPTAGHMDFPTGDRTAGPAAAPGADLAAGHAAYNVASGEPHTVGELAAELSRAAGGPEPRVVGGGRPGDVRHIVADPARIRADLGFEAQVGFAEGVAEFAHAPQRDSAG